MNPTKPISWRRIYGLALPAAGSAILNTLYSINDFFWAGRLGVEAVSALGLVMMILIFNAGLMSLVQKGTLSLVARMRGMEDGAGLRRAAAQGLLLNLLLSILFAVAGWLLSSTVVEAMGGEGLVKELAAHYLRLIYLGFPLMSTAMVLDGIFIGLGDTKTPFRLQLIGVGLNTGLNAASVLLFHTGLTGIALASIFSRTVAAALGAWILSARLQPDGGSQALLHWRKRLPGRRHLVPVLETWHELLRVGLPAALSIAFYSGIFMVLNRILAQFGQIAYGVIGVGIRGNESIGFMILIGFGAAASSLSGECAGRQAVAGNEAGCTLRGTIGRVLAATYAPALFFTLIWLLIPEALCRIYTDDPELIRMSANYLRMAAIANLFQTMEMVLQEGMTGAGNSSAPLWITVPGNLLRIPLALALVHWTSWGINAVWAAILISSMCKGVGMALVFASPGWLRDAKDRASRLARQRLSSSVAKAPG